MTLLEAAFALGRRVLVGEGGADVWLRIMPPSASSDEVWRAEIENDGLSRDAQGDTPDAALRALVDLLAQEVRGIAAEDARLLAALEVTL